jgi:hypothetical protein
VARKSHAPPIASYRLTVIGMMSRQPHSQKNAIACSPPFRSILSAIARICAFAALAARTRVGLESRSLGKIRPVSERDALIRIGVLTRLLSEALSELDAHDLSSRQLLDQLREVGDHAAEQLDQLAPCGRE